MPWCTLASSRNVSTTEALSTSKESTSSTMRRRRSRAAAEAHPGGTGSSKGLQLGPISEMNARSVTSTRVAKVPRLG